MPEIPPALTGWYRTNYSTLTFKDDWLEACVEYLRSNDAAASTTQGLIKAVEVQLLSSDLSTSVIPPASHRALLSTKYRAKDKVVLFQGGAKKAGVLFQVQQLEDVAHSAAQAYDVLRKKREFNRVGNSGAGGGGRIMDLDDAEEDEDEAKKAILRGTKEPAYPRGSGKLVLSDGANEVTAFELQRIPGLGMGEGKLGTKLLVHDVKSVNGILMLTPQNTVVKGYQVEELEAEAEWQFENSLRRRLRMAALPRPDDAAAPEGQPDALDDDDLEMKPPRPPSPPRQRPPASASAATRPKPPPSSSAAAKPKPAPSSDDYFDDSLDFDMVDPDQFDADEDEEAALRATEAVPPRAAQPARLYEKPASSATAAPSSSTLAGRSSWGASGRSASRPSGKVEVLELDSEEEEEKPKLPAKKAKAQGGGSGAPKIAKKPVVLELDSD
ncbi:hypothetical protein JCM10207_004008 [Rhodosporidiobolus poonsookiae]